MSRPRAADLRTPVRTNMDGGSSFAELLRRFRLRAGLTQQELAERSGLSLDAVSALERGHRRRPHRGTVDLLAQALRLSAGERERFGAATRPADERGWGLPVPATPLLGRAQDVERTCGLLAASEARLVTLTGPAGVGKSRLGLAVASRLGASGTVAAVLVALAPIADPELVAGAVRKALDVRDSGRRPLPEALAGALRGRQVLLVMDNFEHVLPAAPLFAELLAQCPGLRVLATSRARLRLRGERVVEVQPLPLPDPGATPAELAANPAVALFVDRARAIDPEFRLTPDIAPAVTAICRRLDGLPLALELAAAQTRALTVQGLLERLNGGIDVLVGTEEQPEHQRTMRGTLGLSYAMLSGDERALFRALAVFPGPAGQDAIEAVSGACGLEAPAVPPAVAGLVDKSLVRREPGDGGPGLTMLEVVRELAAETLRASGDEAAVAEAMVGHYHELAKRAETGLVGAEQAAWGARLEREYANIQAALARARDGGDVARALDMAARLWRFWAWTGRWRDGARWYDLLLAGDAPVPAGVRARALTGAGNLAWGGDWRRVAARYEESLALYRATGDVHGVAGALNNLGLVAQKDGDHARAMGLFGEAIAIFERLGDQTDLASCLDNLGISAGARGDVARGLDLVGRGLTIRRRESDALGVARSSVTLGMFLVHAREFAAARTALHEAVGLAREHRDDPTLAIALTRLAGATHHLGDGAAAAALYREASAVAERLGSLRVIALCLDGLAELAAAQGVPARAAWLLGAADRVWDALGGIPEPAGARMRARVRATLGEQRFAAEIDRTRGLPVTELVREAARLSRTLQPPGTRLATGRR